MLIEAWAFAGLLVVLVSLAMLGFGLAAARYTKHGAAAVPFGSGIFCSLLVSGGCLGLYNWAFHSALIVLGFGLLFQHRSFLTEIAEQFRSEFRGKELLWLLFPLLYLLAQFFSTGLPQQHSDPLYYHLVAPKRWAEAGQIYLQWSNPSYAQAQLWDAVYGTPQLLYAWIDGLKRDVITQIFGQWMHLLWGQVGTIVLGAALIRILASKLGVARDRLPSLAFCFFAGWLCTTIASMEWTARVAKNDYLILAYSLGAVVLALLKRPLAAGICMGFAFSVKIFAVWTGLAILFLLPWRGWGWYVVGGIIGSLPILARNLAFTGNPVFPAFDQNLGPGWVSDTWNLANLTFAGPPRFDLSMFEWMWRALLMKKTARVLLFVLSGLYALSCILKRRIVYPAIWPFVAVQILGGILILRPQADGRYLAPTICIHFLMLAAISVASWKTFGTLASKFSWRSVIAMLFGLIVNIAVYEYWTVPRDYLFSPMTKYIEQFHPNFADLNWINQNTARTDLVYFNTEKVNFYLNRPYSPVLESKRWEKELSTIHSLDDLVKLLRPYGVRYLHFSLYSPGYLNLKEYPKEVLTSEYNIVFKGPNSVILDVKSQN